MSKSIFEVEKSLPLDQRQALWDNMVLTLQGKPTKPLIFTTETTISNDVSLDEEIRLTALALGIGPERIDREDFIRSKNQIPDSKAHIKELVKNSYDFESKKENLKKNDEIVSVGKFLYTTNLANKLIPDEKPDFIITDEKHSIGLEHTRLEAETDKAYTKEIWKKYLNDVLKQIIVERPNLLGIANITLDSDVPIFEGSTLRDFNAKPIKENLKLIHKSITEALLSQIDNTEINLPIFIKSLTYQSSNESFSLKYNQEYFVRTDFEEMLKNSIQKKENKLSNYKAAKDFKEWWLLVVYSDGGSSSAFKISENSLSSAIETSFDRIFILNSFNLACHELIKTNPYLIYVAKKQFTAPKINPVKP